VLFYGADVKSGSEAPKRWVKTRLQNLVRHSESGRYYARIWSNGKEVWKSLKTSHFSVAEARLSKFKNEQRARVDVEVATADAKITVGEAAAIFVGQIEADASIKSSTKAYQKETLKALEKSWPALFSTEIRKIGPGACREWGRSYSRQVSATRFNGTLSTLRRIFDIALKNGVIYSNPAAEIGRRSVKAKKLELPSRDQFAAFVVELARAGGRDSRNCSDLVQGLAFTGMRKGEARHLAWEDLNFASDLITVRGDPEEGTKNGEIRIIPMIPEARALFSRMQDARATESGAEKVFLVNECQKAMDRAVKLVGMARITHHDLRHFFATVCIESGVDIPTVSRWLGHKDGGALAMKTYGHLRQEHSLAQARKVSFIAA